MGTPPGGYSRVVVPAGGVALPPVPDAPFYTVHPYGRLTGPDLYPDGLAGVPRGTAGRLEVHLPLWRGPCGPPSTVLGDEDEPRAYVDAVERLVATARPTLAPDGVLWLWLVESTRAYAVRQQPDAATLARIRDGGRPTTAWNHAIVPEYGVVGVLGERAWCEQFGGRIYAIPGCYGATDGGRDARTLAGTVNVKTAKHGGSRLLLQRSHQHTADISVLAIADAALSRATLVGWEYTQAVIARGETFDPGHNEPAWCCPRSALRPMADLAAFAGVTTFPDEPLGLVAAIVAGLTASGWRRWGTAWVDARRLVPGVPRLYVFSPPLVSGGGQ